MPPEPLPPEYQRFVLEDVRPEGESLTIRYAGRLFGGIIRCQLPIDIEAYLRPGTEIFVRYHQSDTGQPGQIAHMVVQHPTDDVWAEVFSD